MPFAAMAVSRPPHGSNPRTTTPKLIKPATSLHPPRRPPSLAAPSSFRLMRGLPHPHTSGARFARNCSLCADQTNPRPAAALAALQVQSGTRKTSKNPGNSTTILLLGVSRIIHRELNRTGPSSIHLPLLAFSSSRKKRGLGTEHTQFHASHTPTELTPPPSPKGRHSPGSPATPLFIPTPHAKHTSNNNTP